MTCACKPQLSLPPAGFVEGHDDHSTAATATTTTTPVGVETGTMGRTPRCHQRHLRFQCTPWMLITHRPTRCKLPDQIGVDPPSGFYVLITESEEEARALADQDPFHKAGLKTYELKKWTVSWCWWGRSAATGLRTSRTSPPPPPAHSRS